MKICKICLLEKNEEFFEKGRNQCRECRKKQRSLRYESNIEHYKTKRKEQYEKNKESEKEKRREYYLNNKDKEKNYQKRRFQENPEAIRSAQRKWNKKNPDNKRNRDKKYYQNNKKKIQKRQSKYIKIRKLNDPLFRLKILLRTFVGLSIKRGGSIKNKRTESILGCSFDEFKIYLESKFEPWMNWENHGLYNGEFNYGWDIDHIIPISSAQTEIELLKLNNFKNLQPLCSKVNRDFKRDKVISDIQIHSDTKYN